MTDAERLATVRAVYEALPASLQQSEHALRIQYALHPELRETFKGLLQLITALRTVPADMAFVFDHLDQAQRDTAVWRAAAQMSGDPH